MQESYTQESSSLIFDFLDREVAAIWEDIESTPSDTSVQLWEKKLTKIAKDHSFSSRFALMRILFSRANNLKISSPDFTDVPSVVNGFELTVGDKTYSFCEVSLHRAESLTPNENLMYVSCLMDIADLQADCDPDVNEYIISRAWYDESSANEVSAFLNKTNKKRNRKFKTQITREEALQLGHILDFSIEEMQWFLLRVFDSAEGLRMNHSEDLIEAFGFLTGASWLHVLKLQNEYIERSATIQKSSTTVLDNGWTKDMSDTLYGKVEQWKFRPESLDSNFMDWMCLQAPRLDVPSQTAGRIYRNLAAFAHDLVTGTETTPSEEEYADCIQDIYEEEADNGAVIRLLYDNGALSERKCKAVADSLMLENRVQSKSVQPDNTKAWHVLSVKKDGTLSSTGGAVYSGRTRLADILVGKTEPEKGDMLYLLWFTSNLIWQISDLPDTNALCCRILDFMDTAKCLLEAALLPTFYPPHPIEQSMLLSIVSGRTEDTDPSVIYEGMLQALKETRERPSGSKKHSKDYKIKVVSYYREHPDLSLPDCALKFEISPKTLSAWQKELLEEGSIK